MEISFVEEMVNNYPKGFDGWKMYRIEYSDHTEESLMECIIWLPPKSSIEELEYLFEKWQQPIYEKYEVELPKRKLIRNRARCKKCGDIIESKYRHDFVECKCGSIFIDGGLDYMRMGGNAEDIDNLSEWGDI